MFCALTAPASADGNTGLIFGRVFIDGTNSPACPTTVTLTSDREPPQQTVTDRDGTFHFLTVIPGRATVQVGRIVRDVSVSANIPNMDLYVRPIYVPRQRGAPLASGRRLRLRACDASSISSWSLKRSDDRISEATQVR
jgi:hypothetical protein